MDLYEIVKHLPGDWKVLEGKSIFLDIGCGGYILHLSNFKPVGRITVTGKLPSLYGEPYEWDGHKITVSAKKSSEQIAKDIIRRFLSKYQQKFDEIIDSIEKVKDEINQIQNQAQEIADILGYTRNLNELYLRYTRFNRNIGFDFGGLSTSGRVDINLNLTFGQAKKVAELLKEMGVCYG